MGTWYSLISYRKVGKFIRELYSGSVLYEWLDGEHIKTLLLRFMLLYCRPLLAAGKVYTLIPPLFGVKIKGKMKYFTDRIDYIKYVQSLFCSSYQISYTNGKTIANSDITSILYNNMDYVSLLESIAMTYAIHPNILELILINRNETPKKFKSIVEKAYRFAEVTKSKDGYIIRGLMENEYHTIIFDSRLLNACTELIGFIDSSINYFKVNGEVMSLYNMMKLFNSTSPNGLNRYKGLGEMNADQLSYSTLRPEHRTLKRYTVEDVEKEIEEIRLIDSDKSVLLKGIKIRKEDVM